MGRAPCCDKANVKKGPWSPEEDAKLKAYIEQHGTGGNWIALPQKIGLKRCGKSCRLRWLNYLRPNLRHGGFSEEEDNIICSLYINIGSRWSIIAAQLPGRTDNDIKNYWNTRLKKKLLGKQRKEARRSATMHKHQHQQQQQQQQQHHEATIVTKGEMVMDLDLDHDHHESFMAPSSGHGGVMMTMMNHHHQAPYWPHHLLEPPPAALPVQDQEQEQGCLQDLIKNLLIKLEGRFSEEPNTTHLDLLHQYHPIDHDQHTASFNNQLYANNTNDMVSSYDHDEYMLQQLENYPVELSDLVYGDEQQGEHGAATFINYGINSTVNDVINVSTTGTSSSESSSTNWGTQDHLDFPPMTTFEANCQQLQQQQQNAIFQESSYFGSLQ